MAFAAVLLAACSTTASPAPTIDATQALVAGIMAVGTPAYVYGTFSTEPIGGRGQIVCAGSEEIQVHEFDTAAARQAVAAQIDPSDPSKVGTSMIDWVGQPHFWQRDRLLVLSVGGSARLMATLTAVLGRPFAEGSSAGESSVACH